MGMMIDPQWGGSGLDAMSYVLAMEEISAVDASVGVVMSVKIKKATVECTIPNAHSYDTKMRRVPSTIRYDVPLNMLKAA